MKKAAFQKMILKHYTEHGRHDLPWRRNISFYHVLVSEMMLQQTQVDRVIPKFNAWVDNFPDFESLSDASFQEVMTHWQGLGYGRRAKYLHQIAELLKNKTEFELLALSIIELDLLPGVGPYTARAIKAFTSESREVFIETNIRTIFIHHFFEQDTLVSDADILELIEKTLPEERMREWYWALMDYGSYLKKSGVRNNTQSKTYTKQTKFAGSNRQARGQILAYLVAHGTGTHKQVRDACGVDEPVYLRATGELHKEHFITISKVRVTLARVTLTKNNTQSKKKE